MNAIYAVVDRASDHRLRILGEYRDPHQALAAARLLRWAGASVEVLLVTAIHEHDA